MSTLKSALKGNNRVTCSTELRDYLDINMPGWRDDHTNKNKGGSLLPTSETSSHASNGLRTEKMSICNEKGTNGSDASGETGTTRPPPTTSALMPIADGIVKRYKERGCVLPSLKAECRENPTRAQEYKDAGQLHSWKIRTDEKLTPEVLSYLNANMPEWRKSSRRGASRTVSKLVQQKQSAQHLMLMKAREIVHRCSERVEKGRPPLPRHLPGKLMTAEDILEQKDAQKLSEWKRVVLSQNNNPSDDFGGGMSWELKEYLDKELKGWFIIDTESPASYPYAITSDAGRGCGAADNNRLTQNHSTIMNSSSEPVDRLQASASCTNDSRDQEDVMKGDEKEGVAALLQLSNVDMNVHNHQVNRFKIPRRSDSKGHCANSTVDVSNANVFECSYQKEDKSVLPSNEYISQDQSSSLRKRNRSGLDDV